MTPTPTDLKNAKEFVEQFDADKETDLEQDEKDTLAMLCAQYLLHEVAAGRVKFTANREEV